MEGHKNRTRFVVFVNFSPENTTQLWPMFSSVCAVWGVAWFQHTLLNNIRLIIPLFQILSSCLPTTGDVLDFQSHQVNALILISTHRLCGLSQPQSAAAQQKKRWRLVMSQTLGRADKFSQIGCYSSWPHKGHRLFSTSLKPWTDYRDQASFLVK